MAIKTIFRCFTLRGDMISPGIRVEEDQILFAPRWGMKRHSLPLLAAVSESGKEQLFKVYVALIEKSVTLTPCEGEPSRELVLVQQYTPGCGAKRWPGFKVQLDDEVRLLSQASTAGGSGREHWLLVSAPLGWAENIAAQFENVRDYPLQIIAFKQNIDANQPLTLPLQVAFNKFFGKGVVV